MNFMEQAIGYIAPSWALSRYKNRMQLKAAYEALTPGRLRRTQKEARNINDINKASVKQWRELARQLEQNYDLVNGVLNALVNNTVGQNGIQIEPQPKLMSGEIATGMAAQITKMEKDWAINPEVTMEHDKGSMSRLMARTAYRDGEVFAQTLSGRVAGMDHGTLIPFSVEMIEPDSIPLDFDDVQRLIIQGVQRNAWGKPLAYHMYKIPPGEPGHVRETMAIKAEQMLHFKHITRIRQVRGVSILASVFSRLQDLKEYEEAERVAAKVAAVMTAFIKRGTPDMYVSPDDGAPLYELSPGMVFDGLQIGEDIGTIDPNRPSQLLQPFRDSMLKAVASGTGAGYSTISRDYDGSYSSQRQELVEQWINYLCLQSHYVCQIERPMYQRRLLAAIAAGVVQQQAGLDETTLFDAEFRGPVMPWIDPEKEAKANLLQCQAGFKSVSQVIRERGGQPSDVLEQIAAERALQREREIVLTSNAEHGLDNAFSTNDVQTEDDQSGDAGGQSSREAA